MIATSAAIVDLGRIALIVAALASVVLLVVWTVYLARRAAVVREFKRHYASAGKDLLIVLTDSPHWQAYIESQWMPRWGARAVVFNRSRPWDPNQPEARLWYAVKGFTEHTPLAVVVPVRGRVRIVRFFRAFRDHKHGNGEPLRAAERELEAALGIH